MKTTMKRTTEEQKKAFPRNKWDNLKISVPGRIGADGTETPASHFNCEVRQKDNGHWQVMSAKRIN